MAEILTTQSVADIGTPDQKPKAPALPTLAGQLPATPGRILVRRVIRATAEHFGTSPDDLVSARRTRPLARRRQVAMYVARKMTGRAIKCLLDTGDAETVAAVGAIKERLQVLRTGRA
jgi:hypothetical protein